MRAVHHFLRGLAELLLPAACASCGALTDEETPFCDPCAATLEAIDRPCARCGLPLPPGPIVPCLGCAAAPPAWAIARAPYVFGGELAVAVRRWKLGGASELTRPLAQLLRPSLDALPAGVDALVPVPLHARRLRARRFNQSSLLARAARRRGAHPPVAELLDRVRDTPTQSSLSAAERRANVRGAFAPASRRDLSGAHLVVVDDILTTGATASACARALYAGGAARVDVSLPRVAMMPPGMDKKRDEEVKVLLRNRKVRHEYFVEETLEAGIELQGSEVKSLRAAQASMSDAYAAVKNGQMYLHQLQINEYPQANIFNHPPKRDRRLLLHKREIEQLEERVAQQGYTLLPLEIYLKGGRIKVQLGVCKGKQLHDKRATQRDRESRREIDRAMSTRRR